MGLGRKVECLSCDGVYLIRAESYRAVFYYFYLPNCSCTTAECKQEVKQWTGQRSVRVRDVFVLPSKADGGDWARYER